MAGALLALAIFGWYNVFRNRDATSLAYGVWIVVAFLSSSSLFVHDGQRIFEFFVDWQDTLFTHLYASETAGYVFGYGQSMTYAIFARTFLDVKHRFPFFYKVTNHRFLKSKAVGTRF